MEVKCEKSGNENPMTAWIDTEAVTRITTKMHRTSWTIENVSKFEEYGRIIGPRLHLTTDCMVNISFERNEADLCVFVTNESDYEIQIERKISLVDCNSRKLHEEHDAEIFTLEKDEMADIIGDINGIMICDNLPNDTLVIDVCIGLRGEISTKISRFQYVTDSKKKLIEDLKAMQENSVNSDVSLQVDQDQIPVHWPVLCSRSQYFKRMFNSEMLDRNQNTITITDLSLCALKKLVQFLYTADFDESNEDDIEELFQLYNAAHKYEIMEMRVLCLYKLMSKITTDNVCQILQFTYRHSEINLKLRAMEFIRLNSDAVFQTEGWKKIQSAEPLTAELLTFFLKKNKSAC